MEKNKIKDKLSTIVVMRGPAIIEGSNLNTFAIIGSNAPISFATITDAKRVIPTERATNTSL